MKCLHLLLIWLLTLPGLAAYAHKQVVVIPLGDSPDDGPKLLFMTNGEWKGNLEGLQGADEKCNAEASSRGFSGTFQALLATSSSRPDSRSNHYTNDYLNPVGKNLRSGYYFLFSQPYLDNPVLPSGTAVVWTGLNIDKSSKDDHCHNWTSDSALLRGGVGFADAYGANWVDANEYNCNVARHLYCIEQ